MKNKITSTLTIEWPHGLCEIFDGNFDRAQNRVVSMGRRDFGEVMVKQVSPDEQRIYEYRREPEGMAWAFIGKIYKNS